MKFIKAHYIKCAALPGQLRTDTMIPSFSVSFLTIISVAIIIRSALNINAGNISSFLDFN